VDTSGKGLVMKKKQNYNITLDYNISQDHSQEIASQCLHKWDIIDFTTKFGVSGIVLQQLQNDEALRKEIKGRLLARFDELIDSVTVI
jgi:hypothetical protein